VIIATKSSESNGMWPIIRNPLMCGFHLINTRPELIQSTVADIKAKRPDYIARTHCTGFEAIVTFSREMPNEFVLNTASTQYTFAA
jgi:metal-dependent hydrolase (beta-lactamase superfamily II)